MNYYSLNHIAPNTTFKNAVIRGLAPDRGLYFPETITALDPYFFETIETLSNKEIAYEAIKQFISPEIPEAILKNIVSEIKKENWKTSESTIKKLKQYRNDPEKILERFRKVHRKKYDYSKVKYVSLTKKIIIICKKHGEFQITPKSHIGRDSKNVFKKRDAVGCDKCLSLIHI